jgi:hypothetical protein
MGYLWTAELGSHGKAQSSCLVSGASRIRCYCPPGDDDTGSGYDAT